MTADQKVVAVGAKPIYHAPGMAATSDMNLGMLLFVIYRIVVS